MSRGIKIIYGLVLSFSLCFIMIGYAALSDSLNLDVNVLGEAQENVFVYDVLDKSSNAIDTSFYSTFVYQSFDIEPNTTVSYTVKLYNNNDTNKFIYDGYTCEFLPEGVSIIIKEVTNDGTTENVIGSLIDSDNYDTFEVYYTNNNTESVKVESPIKFKYTELTNQVRVDFIYDGETYNLYVAPETENGGTYNDAVFSHVPIDTSKSANTVARCNNGAILKTTVTDGKTYLTISNITNKYQNAGVGELAVHCELYDSLGRAFTPDSGEFADTGKFAKDTTPNNFIVLKEIYGSYESKAMKVEEDYEYSLNLNSFNVKIIYTILNQGKLTIYDGNYLADENISTIGQLNILGTDLIHNIKDTSELYIDHVKLSMQYTSSPTLSSSSEEAAIVVGYRGYVEINKSNLRTNYGYGIYKKSWDAGNIDSRTASYYESKIVVKDSVLISDYNNAARFADGTGVMSFVNSYVSSCENTETIPTDAAVIRDPIYVCRHPNEYGTEFDKFYANALTDIKVYVTGGTLVRSCYKVNHFFSDQDLNARIYYTKSAKFITAHDTDDTIISVSTEMENDGEFNYSIAMINGNGANYSDLYDDNDTLDDTSDDILNKDHYLNNDGWYYIYTTVTDEVDETYRTTRETGETQVNSQYKTTYKTTSYINQKIANAATEYRNLTRKDGRIIRVGDEFEMINFNNVGLNYIDVENYDNKSINFFVPLQSIPEQKSQSDYMDIKHKFTFLASSDQYFFNIASLAYLNNLFHVEFGSYSPIGNNTGIKLIGTVQTDKIDEANPERVNSGVQADVKNQRFTIMEYDHYNRKDGHNPYVFVSQYGSVLSYMSAKVAKTDDQGNSKWDANGVPVWDTSVKYADKYFADSELNEYIIDGTIKHALGVTVPGFIINNPTTDSNGNYVYDYEYPIYLISNHTFPGFQRNGWYLWQQDVPLTYTDIWRYQDYYNLMLLGLNGKLTQHSDNELDEYTNLYISSQSEPTEWGIILNSNHESPNISGNDYGYVRVDVSDQPIKGISFHISRVDNNTQYPWLLIRMYNSSRKRIDVPISTTSSSIKYYKYSDDEKFTETDSGTAYYIIITDTSKGNLFVTVLFSEGTQYEDVYSVILQPIFDVAGVNNTMMLKTITVIGDYKEHLKEYVNK